MSSDEAFTYIEPQALAGAISETKDKNKKDFVIVDVRDDDFEGGHISGAINKPSSDFNDPDTLNSLLEDNKDVSTIIFHCFQSQIRGPTCARVFASHVAKSIPDPTLRPNIKVLRGGYNQWRDLYQGESNLIEE